MTNLPELPDIPDIDPDIDPDNWTQRLKENPYDPLEDMRRKNALFLSELEFFALEALFTGDWDSLFDFINEARGVKNPPRLRRVSLQEFLEMHPCTSTQRTTTVKVDAAVELETPSSDPIQTTAKESIGLYSL